MENVPVVILAGGLGMRIREESEFRPKPMIPVGERPILWHIMKVYSHYGFKRFVICTGYKGDVIKHYFLNYSAMQNDFTITLGNHKKVELHSHAPERNWKVTVAETGRNSMTGSRIKRIQPYIKSQTFMVTYGDGVADIDLKALLKFHRSHGKIGTVTGVSPSSRFGELLVDKKRVKAFAEKPLMDHSINGGFFVFEREFFDYLPVGDDCVLEKEPLENLAKDGELMMFSHKGFWHCMDTIRDMNQLNEMWQSGKAPWKIWNK